jgi:flagellin
MATVITAADIGASAAAATNAIKDIDVAIDKINSERATYGASQNRFDAIISNLAIANENTQAARGRIMDADFAQETANLSRAQILQQAGNAMVAQANQLPQGVMALLKG